MAAQIPVLGTLNRALTAVSVIDYPDLNVTTGYFGVRMASLAFEGDPSDYIAVAAGAVPSPRIYQIATVTMYLNKSQGLANQWEQQRLTNTSIGDVNFVSDSSTLQEYYINNCTIKAMGNVDANGDNNDFMVTVQGTYYINNDIWQ